MVEIIYGGGNNRGKSLAARLARAIDLQSPKRQRNRHKDEDEAPRIPTYRPYLGRRVLPDLTFYSPKA